MFSSWVAGAVQSWSTAETDPTYRQKGEYMDDNKNPELTCNHQWIRSLIKRYNSSTDPIEREELMRKITEAKAKIDYEQMVIACG